MHISGIIIYTKPETKQQVVSELNKRGLCEIYGSGESGEIIAVMEGKSVKEETQKMEKIQKMDGVLSAAMAFAYSDAEDDENLE